MFAEYIGGADIFGCRMEINMKIDYLRNAKWIFANTEKRQIVDSYFCYEKNFFLQLRTLFSIFPHIATMLFLSIMFF